MAAVNINQLPLQLQNPVHFTHAHFFRLARLMAINKELYKRFRTRLPGLLDIRDYVSATKKILSEYKHTHEFYKAWMLLNLQFYKRIKEEKAMTLLLQFNEHALNELLQLQRSEYFEPFTPPKFSIYYNPQQTLFNGLSIGPNQNKLINVVTKRPSLNLPDIYGIESSLENYILADEVTEIMKNVYLFSKKNKKSKKYYGGEAPTTESDLSFDAGDLSLQEMMDMALPASIVGGNPEYNRQVALLHKATELSNKFLHLASDYCTAQNIPFDSTNCLEMIDNGLYNFKHHLCKGKTIDVCLKDYINKSPTEISGLEGAPRIITMATPAGPSPVDLKSTGIADEIVARLETALAAIGTSGSKVDHRKIEKNLAEQKALLDAMAKLLDTLTNTAATKTHLEENKADLLAEFTDVKNKLSEISAKLSDTSNIDEIRKLTDYLTDATQKHADLSDRLNNCGQDLSNVTKDLGAKNAEIATMQRELETLKTETERLIGVNKNLNTENSELNQKCREKEQELNKKINKLENAKAHLITNVTEFAKSNKNLRTENEQYNKILQQISDQLAKLTISDDIDIRKLLDETIKHKKKNDTKLEKINTSAADTNA